MEQIPFNHHFPMVFLCFPYGFPPEGHQISPRGTAAKTPISATSAKNPRSQSLKTRPSGFALVLYGALFEWDQ